MAIPSRAAIRARWVALATAQGSWNAVYDHQPDTFEGATEVATVHGGVVEQDEVVFGGEPDVRVSLLHTNLVRRDDPDAAEDALDALLQATGQLATDNRTDALWSGVRIAQAEPDYYVIDGKPYRAEVVRLVFSVFM